MTSIKYHIQSIIEVFKQLSKGRFLVYFIPGIVITVFYYWLSSLAGNIAESTSWLDNIPLVGVYLNQGIGTTLSVVGFIFDQIYIFFIITLLSPFNTLLSEKLDTRLTGKHFSGGFARIVNDLIRMIFIVIISLLLEFVILGTWWFISWIFGISDFIYLTLSFLMASFFFGFSFYDHSLERYNVNVFGSLGFAFSKMLLVTITGSIFQLIYFFPYNGGFPFIGIMLAPVLTTMISTVVYLYYRKKLPIQPEINSTDTSNKHD